MAFWLYNENKHDAEGPFDIIGAAHIMRMKQRQPFEWKVVQHGAKTKADFLNRQQVMRTQAMATEAARRTTETILKGNGAVPQPEVPTIRPANGPRLINDEPATVINLFPNKPNERT